MTAIDYAKFIVRDYGSEEGKHSHPDAIVALGELILAYENQRVGLSVLRDRISELERVRNCVVTININSSVMEPGDILQSIKQALDAPNSETT